MRFEYSPETSSCLKDGSSPAFDIETVGNDSSSLTPGSSIASVAGKKRLPTISCARADVEAGRVAASMARGHEFLNMEKLRYRDDGPMEPRKAALCVRRNQEGLGRALDRRRHDRGARY